MANKLEYKATIWFSIPFNCPKEKIIKLLKEGHSVDDLFDLIDDDDFGPEETLFDTQGETAPKIGEPTIEIITEDHETVWDNDPEAKWNTNPDEIQEI